MLGVLDLFGLDLFGGCVGCVSGCFVEFAVRYCLDLSRVCLFAFACGWFWFGCLFANCLVGLFCGAGSLDLI